VPSVGASLLIVLCLIYLVITLCISFISCTCWVPTLSILNLASSPLLLKPIAQKEKMDWNSSTRSSRLRVAPVTVHVELWSLFVVSLCLTVIIVFVDIIYVIITLYS
jgi:hypothetical protein